MAGEGNDESADRNRDIFSPGGGTPDPSRRSSPERDSDSEGASQDPSGHEPNADSDQEPFPGQDDGTEDPYQADKSGGGSIFEHPALPWVAVAFAVLVVFAVILLGRGSDSEGPTGAAPSGETSNEAPEEVVKKEKACKDFSYGANLLGIPGVASEPGVHIWHDIQGFHLRLVKGEGSVDALAGTIGWVGDEMKIDPADTTGALVGDGKIDFELTEDGQEVHFRAACKTESVIFDLQSAGSPLDPAIITVGRGNGDITDNPLTLKRGG